MCDHLGMRRSMRRRGRDSAAFPNAAAAISVLIRGTLALAISSRSVV